MTNERKTFPAEFSELMQQYKAHAASLGDDHPITRRLWMLVEHSAPAWFRDEMRQMAHAMNLIPTPRMCNDDGEPLLTTGEMAAHLGISIEEAQASIERFIADRKALGLPADGIRRADPDKLNPIH